jgi:hypothetical protein
MGTWGTALYSDDLAADLRGDFRDAAGDGLSAVAIVDRLAAEYASSVDDAEESATFWLVLADMGWRLGRLDERALRQALSVIDGGRDLARWDAGRDRTKRAAVLAKVRDQLLTPPPPPKRVARRIVETTTWEIGDVIAFRLRSGRQTLLRVIGHHEDNGGRSAVCELLDWIGEDIPPVADIDRLGVRFQPGRNPISAFMLSQPRRQADRARVAPTGLRSTPSRSRMGITAVFVWPHVDRLVLEYFGVD